MEHLINLNFAPGGLPAVIHVSQYDDTLRQLKFQLWFGRSKVEVPSGAAVRVDIKKPDGHIVLVSGTVDTQDRSIVTVPTTKQMTAAPGGARGMLVVTGSGDKRISSALFVLQVHRDPVEDGDASDSDLSMLQDAIDQTAANATAAQAAATAAQQAASSFTTDPTLSVSGKAADAKKTGDEISAIKADLDSLEPGLSNDAKIALLACFEHVAWTDAHGQDYYDALEEALYADGYPLISVEYNPGTHVVYADDDINTLKSYITVTYFETSESSGVQIDANDYSIVGSLTAGSSTLMVYYNQLHKTFNVNGVIAVGTRNYASALSDFTIFQTRQDGTITYDGEKIVFKINTQEGANSYGFSVADTQGSAFSDVDGKKLRIGIKAYSPNWSGAHSSSNPKNCVTWGIALYDNTTTPVTRLRWRNIGNIALTDIDTIHNNVFTINESLFNAGTGTITESSRLGVFFYSYTMNEVFLTDVKVIEVLE